jgi:hypothetical protein
MNQKELLDFAEKTFKECLALMRQKNSDYTNVEKNNDAFRNFTLGEYYNVLSTEQGLWCRLSDKFSRLTKFISSGDMQVKSESVKDTCVDAINYFVLLLAYVSSKQKKNEEDSGKAAFHLA